MDNNFKNPIMKFERFYGKPILKRNGNLIGVGHHSFFHAEDGTLYCAYHCHSIGTENFKPRLSCINTAEFVEYETGIDKLVINGLK